MPPRLRAQARLQLLAHRPKPRTLPTRHLPTVVLVSTHSRGFADDASKKGEDTSNVTEAMPHVSEEAAEIKKIKGEKGPDVNQGTPVEEVVKGDKKTQESLPKVMKDGLKDNAPKGSRSFSTSTRSRAFEMTEAERSQVDVIENHSFHPISEEGHKFGLPSLPLPPQSHLHHRYDPVVDQVTKLLMRDGKLAAAQRNMSTILTHLRTSPPPSVSSTRPLLPNAPPPSHLPLHPSLYLTLAIDSVAPLMRIRALKGAAGGGMSLQVPAPLTQRQRRRTAFMWILDAAEKRKNSTAPFAKRVADEIISVVEGRSGVWDKRAAVHKLGVSSRANLITAGRRRKR